MDPKIITKKNLMNAVICKRESQIKLIKDVETAKSSIVPSTMCVEVNLYTEHYSNAR